MLILPWSILSAHAALVGLYQCIGAVPGVFDVQTPPGLEKYADWIHLLEFDFSISIIIPGTCFGNYQRYTFLTCNLGLPRRDDLSPLCSQATLDRIMLAHRPSARLRHRLCHLGALQRPQK